MIITNFVSADHFYVLGKASGLWLGPEAGVSSSRTFKVTASKTHQDSCCAGPLQMSPGAPRRPLLGLKSRKWGPARTRGAGWKGPAKAWRAFVTTEESPSAACQSELELFPLRGSCQRVFPRLVPPRCLLWLAHCPGTMGPPRGCSSAAPEGALVSPGRGGWTPSAVGGQVPG